MSIGDWREVDFPAKETPATQSGVVPDFPSASEASQTADIATFDVPAAIPGPNKGDVVEPGPNDGSGSLGPPVEGWHPGI